MDLRQMALAKEKWPQITGQTNVVRVNHPHCVHLCGPGDKRAEITLQRYILDAKAKKTCAMGYDPGLDVLVVYLEGE